MAAKKRLTKPRGPRAQKAEKPNVIIPDSVEFFSQKQLISQLRFLGGLPQNELDELLQKQIDGATLAVNAVALEHLKLMVEPSTSMQAKLGHSLILRNLSSISDSVSRQRLVLQKLREEVPGDFRDPSKNRMLIPPELNDADWEKKYAGTFTFGKPSKRPM